MQEIAVAGRAQIRHIYVPGRHSAVDELLVVGQRQIEQVLGIRTLTGCTDHPVLLRFVSGFKFLRHVLTNLVALPADTGSDTADQIRGIGAVLLMHQFYRSCSDLRNGPAPAGVSKPDRAVNGIRKEKRNAVRKRCHQTNSRFVSHKAVHTGEITLTCHTHTLVCRTRDHHMISMLLVCVDHVFGAYADRLPEKFKVPGHLRRVVSHAHTEVHGRVLPLAHASLACRKSVNEPVETVEPLVFEQSHLPYSFIDRSLGHVFLFQFAIFFQAVLSFDLSFLVFHPYWV